MTEFKAKDQDPALKLNYITLTGSNSSANTAQSCLILDLMNKQIKQGIFCNISWIYFKTECANS